MANAQDFLKTWVRENIEATPHRNNAEARRLTYECRKATAQAGVSWPEVIKAGGGDVQGYIQDALSRAAEQEADHV